MATARVVSSKKHDHSVRSAALSGALFLVPLVAISPAAFAAAASIGAHQAQATACRASLARVPAAGGDVRARVDAAVRSEECLVRAKYGALPPLERRPASPNSQTRGEAADV